MDAPSEVIASADMWRWRRERIPEGFPKKFRVQRIGIEAALAVSDLPPSDIAAYFRKHPETARALLSESYDKRYSPSTYITEQGYQFKVGWFSTGTGHECVQVFSNLADAATDYLLLSLGKGRWTA